jgi:hypothetical protein
MENHSLNSNGKYDVDKTAVIKPIRTDLSFLAQDVEAHGLIADVRPLAKDEIMAAARGFRAPTEASPIYTLPDRDAGSLTNGLFKDLFEDPHEAEAAVRVARHMNVICAEIEEERLPGAGGYELLTGSGNVIGNILVFPQGRITTAHVSYAGDAVDDGAGMLFITGAPPWFEQFRVGGCCGNAGIGFAPVVDLDGVMWV